MEQANPVLQALRTRTRALHRETEKALDLKAASASRGAYVALLERLHGFYEPLESWLCAHAAADTLTGIDFERRRKLPFLRADLAELASDSFSRLEPCGYVPRPTGELARVGAWYVVEGATLGGRVIGAHLARHLGLSPSTGASFFDCYGAEREHRWHAFCAGLISIPSENADEVASGAVAVFQALRRWLAEGAATQRVAAG